MATRIGGVLPFDHYSRKMLGYLAAIRDGADTIVDTDDDNTPLSTWGWPSFDGTYFVTPPERGFVNIYRSYSDQDIWPRGFPLNRLRSKQALLEWEELIEQPTDVGIWQALADGDPDVDAIYRLTRGQSCTFEQRPPIVLSTRTLCPFNSQNTAFRKELFPLLYLPSSVTFRFTDILRGLVAQPILWTTPYRLGFTTSTVFQDRNAHDYMDDFESEIPCYLHVDRVVEIVGQTVDREASIADNLYKAYSALVDNDIVKEEELKALEGWLGDLEGLLAS